MRRPSRSFTVEVKRSRSRAGEASGADSREKRGLDPAVTASLSWAELISRAAEDGGASNDQPEIEFWPGVDEKPASAAGEDGSNLDRSAADRLPAPPAPQQSSPGAADARPDAPPAARARVLPSLLPLEIPLSERKSSVYSPAAESRVPPRSQLSKPSPRQTGAPSTPLLRAPSAGEAKVPARPETADIFDAERIRAAVEQRLRGRSAQPETPAPGENPVTEVDAPPTGRRRREDFWKRRLRSYAARN